MKLIPYGLASYKRIREKNCYYLDNTHFITRLRRNRRVFVLHPPPSLWQIVVVDDFGERLNDELEAIHIKGEICLYGGAVMCLVYYNC